MTCFDELRLETPRLVLRPPRADDLDALAGMMLDEPTARFIGGTMPRAVCWRQLMTMMPRAFSWTVSMIQTPVWARFPSFSAHTPEFIP